MKNCYTICTDKKEAIALGRFIVGKKNYEGIYNDSFKDCACHISFEFDKAGRIFVGVNSSCLVAEASEDSMRKKGSRTFISSVDEFKSKLEDDTLVVPQLDFISIEACAPNDLIGRYVMLSDGLWSERIYIGTVEGFGYSNNGLILTIDGRDITVKRGVTKICFRDVQSRNNQ